MLRAARFLITVFLAALSAARADWRDDIGMTRLALELGAAMPTGAGIVLLQSEANNIPSPPNYLPEPGGPGAFGGVITGPFAGKTFHPESGAGTDLGHAATVASYFYGNYVGVARGAVEIHNYTAVDFMDRLTTGTAPEVLPGRVQNHSWAGSFGSTSVDTDAVRAFDFMLNRDARIATIGISGGSLQPLLGDTFHGITAGVRSGNHSISGTLTDGAGRMKPDLVVDQEFTSYAAPIIGGCAACLLQGAIASGNANAEKPQTIKAILLAGASKQNLPQWQRDTTAEPYDDVFGAGELNLFNAWHILQAGEQPHSTSAEVAVRGWDFATTTSNSAGRRYFFTIPAGKVADTFSAALTWHRQISKNIFGDYTSSLTNLTLRLYAASGFTAGALISSSTSSVDNLEHIHLYHLPPGQYVLEVTTNTNGRDYALAWEARIGEGPVLATTSATAGSISFAATSLDPFVTYVIESSPDLAAGTWTTEHTFRTADTTPAFQYNWQDTTPAPDKQFYRLRWTPVR
ncbi:MAG: hypothetical protein JNG86_20535 [Verrucomicrobiaceae bacterium]|nr:hypothetical protein [Verrucomicrobiaceae bacterium]